MSDGEPPVLSYFATSQDSASWLGGAEDSVQDDPFARISSDGALSFASAHSHYDERFVGDGVPSFSASDVADSDNVFSCQTGLAVDVYRDSGHEVDVYRDSGHEVDVYRDSGHEVDVYRDSADHHSGHEASAGVAELNFSVSETNPFLQSPMESASDHGTCLPSSGIDAYFGNAADNWLGDSVNEHSWLASPEQPAHASAPLTAPALPPLLRPGQPISPVAKPALYAVPALTAANSHTSQPRHLQPPPLLPAKPDGFVSPSKFFPPSPAPSHTATFRQSSGDDPVLRKNYPEGRCCGAAWAWGGRLFTFAAEHGMHRTHSVSFHSCGKRAAFQASIARFKAWPGCDAPADGMAKFLNDLKNFKVDDQAFELASPFQDSFEALTKLLSLLLARGSASASQQHLSDLINVFEDSNSFSDSMNLVSNIDAFRPTDPMRDLFQIQQYLLEGKSTMAVEHAMQSDLWAEAMMLSQVNSDSEHARTVHQRLTERCLIAGTPLWFLHALRSGIVPSSPNLHSHWRLCAKILLQNRFSNACEGLRALARAVLTHGDTCAWIVLNATAALFSKEKQQHVQAANFSTPPAADIADLRDALNSISCIRCLKAKEASLLTDHDKRLLSSERDIAAKLDELKTRAPSKEPHQASLFYGYSTEPSPALMHPNTCERAEMFAAAFVGKAKGHTVRGVLYWRFMHAMWMADHGLHADALALFQSVQKRGHEVDYDTGKWLARCAEMAILRLERGKAPSAPSSSSSSGSLFGGIGSFVDSTVKFLVTGADAPAAPIKVDRAPAAQQATSTAAQQATTASSTGPKVSFFNPHAGRQQIAQQLHQQPAQHTQHKPVNTGVVDEHHQAKAAAETAAPPPASPPPKLDRSSSDPVKSDAAKGATVSPGEKQKGKSGWGIGSFIGGIVSKVLPVSKGVEVDLGGESTMYFNEKLGRYVERGKEDEAAAAANIAPPPIMAAWSQPAAAVSPSTQPGFSEDKFAAAGAGVTSAAELPFMAASSLPLSAPGPPMPSGAPRVAAPASASALGKSRYAVAGVAVTPAAAPASSSPASAARPRPQYKVFVPQAAASASEEPPGNGAPGTGHPS